MFAVTIPEQRGSFRRFCSALGQHAITEFNYRIGDAREANIFRRYSNGATRRTPYASRWPFRANDFGVLDLTDDELSKLHLRHMIGGRSPLARDERLYRFDFPERPAHSRAFWNACIRTGTSACSTIAIMAPTTGRILVGIQVPPSEHALLRGFSWRTGIPARGRER